MKIGTPQPDPWKRLVSDATSSDELDHVPVDLTGATDGDVLTYVAADGALELLPSAASSAPSWTRFFLLMGG